MLFVLGTDKSHYLSLVQDLPLRVKMLLVLKPMAYIDPILLFRNNILIAEVVLDLNYNTK